MGNAILRATAISKSFHHVRALHEVSFDLLAGEVHGLMGENGAGKSTFIKILTGAYSADSGSLELAGAAVPFFHADRSQTRRCGRRISGILSGKFAFRRRKHISRPLSQTVWIG